MMRNPKAVFWKRAAAMAMALATLTLLAGCGRSAQSRYTYAQELLAAGELEAARYEFLELGASWDAAEHALYVGGLIAFGQGNWDLAQRDFDNLGRFKSSGLYERYAMAKILETEEDYASAQELYYALGSFGDSADQAKACAAILSQNAYKQAQSLLEKGEYQQAMAAFLALGSFSDSLTKAETCRQALYEAAAAKEKEGGLKGIREAIALYESLDTYADASRKARELKGVYETNNRLRGYQQGWQYVSLGSYPQEAGGGKTPILWRVLSVEDGTALLLADEILDVSAMQPGDGDIKGNLQAYLNGAFFTEAFTQRERAALIPQGAGRVFLLAKEQVMDPGLGFASDATRQARGTAYALSKGLHASQAGFGWWWLSTPGTGENCQTMVYYNGAVFAPGLRADDAQMGVRPAIRLALDALFLQRGSGLLADPFRE